MNAALRPLLDHLIRGGQQRFRDGRAEGFGGLEVDDQFEFRWLYDRQIGPRPAGQAAASRAA